MCDERVLDFVGDGCKRQGNKDGDLLRAKVCKTPHELVYALYLNGKFHGRSKEKCRVSSWETRPSRESISRQFK
jgi:hypothetical protein